MPFLTQTVTYRFKPRFNGWKSIALTTWSCLMLVVSIGSIKLLFETLHNVSIQQNYTLQKIWNSWTNKNKCVELAVCKSVVMLSPSKRKHRDDNQCGDPHPVSGLDSVILIELLSVPYRDSPRNTKFDDPCFQSLNKLFCGILVTWIGGWYYCTHDAVHELE